MTKLPDVFPSHIEVEKAERPLKIAIVYYRLPVPMTRADQMMVAHLLDFLHKRGHQVDLFTLDNGERTTAEGWAWLQERCRNMRVFKQGKGRSLMGLCFALAQRLPLQVGWFHNQKHIQAVRQAMDTEDLDVVYCYYIRSAEALRGLPEAINGQKVSKRTRPVTFLAMQLSQSLNTKRMMETFHNPFDRAIYSVESRLVRRYEAHVWSKFHRSVLIGRQDLEEIKQVCREYGRPEIDNYVFGPHGVDISRYAPRQEVPPEPYTLVFSGVMGTNTNVHAVTWFVDNIWPQIKAAEPAARFILVGRNPAREIRALATQDGIEITGEVPNPADYICRATVCVNPVRAGAGMQNKLLEYLSMGKPVVATTVANEGIGATPGEHLLIADTPEDFAAKILLLLRDADLRAALGKKAREFIEKNWTWEAHFLNLEREMYETLG